MMNPYAKQQLDQMRDTWLQAEQQNKLNQQQGFQQPQQAPQPQMQQQPQANPGYAKQPVPQQTQQPQQQPAKPIYSRGIGQKPFENQDRRFGGYAKLARRTPYYNRNT